MNNSDNKTTSKLYFIKAFELQRRGKYEDAINNYERSIKLFPTAEAFTFLGWTYSFMGNFERAIEECKNAIEVDPEYGNSYNDIGTYHMKLGNYDEALIWFELALKAKRYDHYEFAHFNLGVLFERKGMWFEAVEEYRKAIEINPDYDPAKRAFLALQGKLN
ncbi:MAG: TPR repeat-containing protein [Chlorobi bacterium OLB4]|jgi:tetratricopeptide (TPR) repeat protein|nr:MAG: TPR repeat-containing protein [Chlorobi bacterium OLB4]MBW7856274.1 tetratricopeptide repeat protein [Ignavibacteria bacterium]OQY78873.1 MAG: hypothetical protein B6D43_00695 [Ignavibacteriales bacterium UTCHB1]